MRISLSEEWAWAVLRNYTYPDWNSLNGAMWTRVNFANGVDFFLFCRRRSAELLSMSARLPARGPASKMAGLLASQNWNIVLYLGIRCRHLSLSTWNCYHCRDNDLNLCVGLSGGLRTRSRKVYNYSIYTLQLVQLFSALWGLATFILWGWVPWACLKTEGRTLEVENFTLCSWQCSLCAPCSAQWTQWDQVNSCQLTIAIRQSKSLAGDPSRKHYSGYWILIGCLLFSAC